MPVAAAAAVVLGRKDEASRRQNEEDVTGTSSIVDSTPRMGEMCLACANAHVTFAYMRERIMARKCQN